MDKKKELGQFMTTNWQHILDGMTIPDDVQIIEPFAGKCDLLKFVKNCHKSIECYDIDPIDKVKKRDSLLNPPSYKDKFVLTNPPYLARNKSKNKAIFDKYDVNDLYKCFIKSIMIDKCLGGILIIPLNFWSSIRKCDVELRKQFLDIYIVSRINIFEEQVFDDTTYTICAFQFIIDKKNSEISIPKTDIVLYPGKRKISANIKKSPMNLIGGEIYNLSPSKNYSITRLTSKNKKSDKKYITNILVKCIDDNNNNKINLSYVSDDEIYIDETPNQSARTYATLVINPNISIDIQKQVISKFNTFLNEYRKKYNSLFLTNYRESKDIARKRISFDLVYNLVGYLLSNDIIKLQDSSLLIDSFNSLKI